MLTYRPDQFDRTFALQNGPKIWKWLQSDEVIAKMETASYLRRPAIEPLSPVLKQQFGDQIHFLKTRQMIGHMVRQIMESRGFHLSRANVRISRKGNVFGFGSAYTQTG